MLATSVAAAGSASAVLALSKAAWKLGILLSKLDQDSRIVDNTMRNLAGAVKSLGNECDLVYAELEDVVSKEGVGSPSPCYVDSRIWNCLATQVEQTGRLLEELELFVKCIGVENSRSIGQTQRQRKLGKGEEHLASIGIDICRHIDNFRTTLLLINTVRAHTGPCQADRGDLKELDKLRNMTETLQRSSEANPQSRLSHTEAALIQCARDVIVKSTAVYEATVSAESAARGQGAANSNVRVAEWVSTLELIRQEQRHSYLSDLVSNVPSIFSGEAHTVVTSATSAQYPIHEHEANDKVEDDSDDDLYADLAKAALETGTTAFEAQEWVEADSLLQEALRVLQQLPRQQRFFCDIFNLQYKLAVCAYHTRGPADAEEALMSLVQQSASSDEQRGYIYDATHLLSLLYICTGEVDRARRECEKALQARRRLLGKQDDTSLESMALMAHIYALLNNHARAKSCLAMIPEARRDVILKTVEESLGTKVEQLDSPLLMTRSFSEDSDLARKRQSGLSDSSFSPPMENLGFALVSAVNPHSEAASPRQSHQRTALSTANSEALQSRTVISLSSAEEGKELGATGRGEGNEDDSEGAKTSTTARDGVSGRHETPDSYTLSRKDILHKIGCQPKDRIEEAVCEGDHVTFASLLNRKKDFWRSKVRKRVRPERVTALHFAALFGEIDMARRLLGSSFNINEIPYGYTTSLTPLKFAIGARQVEMVEFLIENGARPSEPDSWSTLAGQLMNRSWLAKTMSGTEREQVPSRIAATMRILLEHGWNINVPIEASGGTVLHQAVAFWTGSYTWDLSLRAAIASFLCEQGANPFQANAEGKTAYDIASASGHVDLLKILDRGSGKKELDSGPSEPVELSA